MADPLEADSVSVGIVLGTRDATQDVAEMLLRPGMQVEGGDLLIRFE
jgi:hypothetical protein